MRRSSLMNNMMNLIEKAKRNKLKLRACIVGVAGSGKTWSSLALATGLGNKTLLIDTERRSAKLYADIFTFDYLPLDPPYSPQRYIDAIRAGESCQYDTIIVDSLSHAWAGTGGVLDIHREAVSRSTTKNEFAAWAIATPQQNKLIDALINRNSPSHLIATLRARANYIVTQKEGGKSQIECVGIEPIQKDGITYEFDIVFELGQDHYATVSSKDRTRIFINREPFIITVNDGLLIKQALDVGEDPVVITKSKEEMLAEINSIKTIKDLIAWNNENEARINELDDVARTEVIQARTNKKAELLDNKK